MTETEDKTYLAIDYGRKRIGVAKSDPTGLIASPITTIEVKSRRQAVAALVELIGEFQPVGLVVGYPLLPSGDRGETCDAVDTFVTALLAEYDLPVFRINEQYTSQEAAAIIHAHGKKIGSKKKRVDRLAAVLILERFLETIER